MRRLWIRADASPSVGLGHVMRVLAMAERVIDRGAEVTFVSRVLTATAQRAISRLGVDLRLEKDSSEAHLLRDVAGGDAVLFDGYGFGPQEFGVASERGARVCLLEDHGRHGPGIDLLIDPAANEGDYPQGDGDLLLGPRFALVRREFLTFRKQRGERADALLLSVGGSHSNEMFRDILQGRQTTHPFSRVIAVGSHDRLGTTPPNVSFVPQTLDVAKVFDQADAAISAGGNSAWELACMGIPLALFELADNQSRIIRRLVGAGAAVEVGHLAESGGLTRGLAALREPGVRLNLSAAGLDLVDGLGADRVAEVLLTA